MLRADASPALLMRPVLSVSPDWYLRGVRPKCAPTSFERRNRAGSSTAEVKVMATTAPTPGTVISRRHTSSMRTIRRRSRCRFAYSARRQGLARPQHRLHHPLQGGLAGHQLADAPLEPGGADRAHLQPEAAEQAADAALEVEQLGLHLLARRQQQADLLGREQIGRASCRERV